MPPNGNWLMSQNANTSNGVTAIVAAIFNVQSYPFGGTTVLIAVGVALETMKQIDSQLMMRNYEGFLKS